MVWISALEINSSPTNHYWGCSNQAWEECIVLSYYIEDCVNGIIVILHQSRIFTINTQLRRRDISLRWLTLHHLISQLCSCSSRKHVVLRRLGNLINVSSFLGKTGKSNKLIVYWFIISINLLCIYSFYLIFRSLSLPDSHSLSLWQNMDHKSELLVVELHPTYFIEYLQRETSRAG